MPDPRSLSLAPFLWTALVLAGEAVGQTPIPPRELAFVANHGQWPSYVAFAARLGAMSAWFTHGGFTVEIARDLGTPAASANGLATRSEVQEGVVLRHHFPRASSPEGSSPLGPRFHFLCGSDPAMHVRDVGAFAHVRYPEAAPGIGILMRGDAHGRLVYDLEVARGADLGAFQTRVEGATELRIDTDDSLVIETAIGPVRHSRPVAWEVTADGARVPVAACFRIIDRTSFGFVAPGHDPARELVVDPVISYHGGSLRDLLYSVARTPAGTVIVAGETQSWDFPTSPGAFQRTLNGTADAVVSCFDMRRPPASQMLWSTYLGGNGHEVAFDVEFAGSMVCVGGITTSTNFPGTPPGSKPGAADGFLVALLADGSTVVYGRYIGGSADDWVCDLAVDSAQRLVVGGYCGFSATLPLPTTANALQTTQAGSQSAFVQRWNLSGTLDYSSFLGGPGLVGPAWWPAWAQGPLELRKLGVAMHPAGDLVVAGIAWANGFPTTPNAWARNLLGASDVFVSQLAVGSAATNLVYSTYFGSGSDPKDWDMLMALAVDVRGRFVLAGSTWATGVAPSTGFPTTPGAIQTTLLGLNDSFVSILDPTGTTPTGQLVYSTLLGTTSNESIIDIDVDARGFVSFSGFTWGAAMPTTLGALQPTMQGPNDAHFGRLRPGKAGLADLIYASFLGGTKNDNGGGLVLGPDAAITLVGVTDSVDFPVNGGRQPGLAGGFDGFVAELEMLPLGVSRSGTTSGHCRGGVILEPDRQPAAGLPMTLLMGNAPANSAGVLLLGFPNPNPGGTPLPWPGLVLWLDSMQPWIPIATASGPFGDTVPMILLPLPFAPVGLTAQSFWVETAACAGQRPLAASAGLNF